MKRVFLLVMIVFLFCSWALASNKDASKDAVIQSALKEVIEPLGEIFRVQAVLELVRNSDIDTMFQDESLDVRTQIKKRAAFVRKGDAKIIYINIESDPYVVAREKLFTTERMNYLVIIAGIIVHESRHLIGHDELTCLQTELQFFEYFWHEAKVVRKTDDFDPARYQAFLKGMIDEEVKKLGAPLTPTKPAPTPSAAP